jgi:hypothetical protein
LCLVSQIEAAGCSDYQELKLYQHNDLHQQTCEDRIMSNEQSAKPEAAADPQGLLDAIVMPDAHDNATTLYCIPMRVETQQKALDEHCFGDCGKISIGGTMMIGGFGPCWVCTYDNCPHENGHTEIVGSSEMTGEPIRIRGLKA